MKFFIELQKQDSKGSNIVMVDGYSYSSLPFDPDLYISRKHQKVYIELSDENFTKMLSGVVRRSDSKFEGHFADLGPNVINAKSFVQALKNYYTDLEKVRSKAIVSNCVYSFWGITIPSVLVYLLGLSLVWIKKGFQKD